jgi:hypothetical protein
MRLAKTNGGAHLNFYELAWFSEVVYLYRKLVWNDGKENRSYNLIETHLHTTTTIYAVCGCAETQ